MTFDFADPRAIAAAWHGGQMSALYAYASTGTIVSDSIFSEIDHCLTLVENNRDERELNTLRSHLVVERRDTILRDVDRLVKTVIGSTGDIDEFSRVKASIIRAIDERN